MIYCRRAVGGTGLRTGEAMVAALQPDRDGLRRPHRCETSFLFHSVPAAAAIIIVLRERMSAARGRVSEMCRCAAERRRRIEGSGAKSAVGHSLRHTCSGYPDLGRGISYTRVTRQTRLVRSSRRKNGLRCELPCPSSRRNLTFTAWTREGRACVPRDPQAEWKLGNGAGRLLDLRAQRISPGTG